MTVIEHSPMCALCGVAYVEEGDGQQCTEGRCTGRVSWEATADAYRQQLQGAVSALAELVAAFEDTYASSVSGSGRYESTIPRLSAAMDAARAIAGGQ